MDLTVSPRDHFKSYSPVCVTVTFTEKRVSADVMTFGISAEISPDLGWAGTPVTAVLIRERKGDLAESQGELMGRDPAEGQSGAPVSVTLPVTSNNTAALPREPPFLTLPPISQVLSGAILHVLRGPGPTQKHDICSSFIARAGEQEAWKQHPGQVGTQRPSLLFDIPAQPPGHFCALSSSESTLRNQRDLYLHRQKKQSLAGVQDACDHLCLDSEPLHTVISASLVGHEAANRLLPHLE